jgi:hypothetical protein
MVLKNSLKIQKLWHMFMMMIFIGALLPKQINVQAANHLPPVEKIDVTANTLKPAEVLAPTASTDLSISITDSADPSSDSTVIMQYKDNNTWAISVDGTEGKTQFINIGDYSYMYSSETDSWFRMPSSTDTDSPFDDFKIDKDEIQTLKDNAVVVGKSGCTLGTCEVYDMTDPDTGDKTTLKIGSGGRIAEMSGTSGTTSTTMVFDYSGPINIETPADYQEFNIPN